MIRLRRKVNKLYLKILHQVLEEVNQSQNFQSSLPFAENCQDSHWMKCTF